MSNQSQKRMIGGSGFEVIHSFPINGIEIILAENMKSEDSMFYRIYVYKDNGIVGEYSNCTASDDYLEILREFAGRVNEETVKIQTERDSLNLPTELFTADDCLQHDYGKSIEDMVIAVKAGSLSPEHRRGDNQLVLVTGGNGSKANARGSAVFCIFLNTGTHIRFERRDILGVVKQLPEWAKQRLSVIQTEKESSKKTPYEKVAGYLLTEQIRVGKMLFVLGENPDAVSPFVTWQKREGRGGYDLGHYFSSREKAKLDLQIRADNEREILCSGKSLNPNGRDVR